MNNQANTYWQALIQSLGTPKEADNIFKDVLASYGQPHRFYHNLGHILNMLGEFESVKGEIPVNNKEAVKLAIWYHDIVYDTAPNHHTDIADNETRSAQRLLADNTRLGLDDVIINKACELILATRHTGNVHDNDAQILVDIDLAILGKPASLFDEYERNIRLEYAWVPEKDFLTGRAKILQSFLERPAIYATPYFREKYENIARGNLKRSIKMLEV